MNDVIIAGGGIAGSALAILLGRGGFQVGLFEQAHFPREKPCGEGIMPAGVAALDRLGLLDQVGGARFHGIRYIAGATTAEGRFPPPAHLPCFGLGQRRLRLDSALFREASSTRGVTVHNAKVESALLECGRVTGVSAGGELQRGCLVVAADGLHSRLRGRLGLDGRPVARRRVGMRAHFRLAAGQAQPPWVEVFLGRGYELYVTPLPDREILVAALAEWGALRPVADSNAVRARHASPPAQRRFQQWIAQQPALASRLRGAEQITTLVGRAPLAQRAGSGAQLGIVLLGDAAGYLDPITGGGISQALLTAELLAGCIPEILANPQQGIAAFEQARRSLLRDYLWLTRLVLALSLNRRVSSAAVSLMRASPRLFSRLIGVAAGTRPLLPFGSISVPESRFPMPSEPFD